MDDYAESTQSLAFAGSGAGGPLGLQVTGTAAAVGALGEGARLDWVQSGLSRQSAVGAKRVVDFLLSACVLLILAPLMLLAALAVMSSGGPVFFTQARVGKDGRRFNCYKFRSMVPGAENLLPELLKENAALRAEWERSQKLRRDPRITRVGAFLRKTSIDELPQLWNVLRGDMSLIGPRPIMLHQLPLYGSQAVCYTAMRPGITGLWQVTARGDSDFNRRIELDCEYVRSFSPATDLRILMRTVWVVLAGVGAT